MHRESNLFTVPRHIDLEDREERLNATGHHRRGETRNEVEQERRNQAGGEQEESRREQASRSHSNNERERDRRDQGNRAPDQDPRGQPSSARDQGHREKASHVASQDRRGQPSGERDQSHRNQQNGRSQGRVEGLRNHLEQGTVRLFFSFFFLTESLNRLQTAAQVSKRRIENRSDVEGGATVKWRQGKIRQVKRHRVSDEGEGKEKPSAAERALAPAIVKVALPDQIKLYEGEIRELLEAALFGVRMYLLCRNAYPTPLKQHRLAKKVFYDVCKRKYGTQWKGMISALLVNVVAHHVRTEKRPEFTKGISSLVSTPIHLLRLFR